MIKKLRRKFILINMIFVASILTVVLGTLYYTNYQRSNRELRMIMKQVIQFNNRPQDHKFEIRRLPEPKPDQRQLRNLMPILLVTLDKEQQIVSTETQNVKFEKYQLQALVDAALSLPSPEGRINDYGLLYLKQDTPEGMNIVFADLTLFKSNMRMLLFNYLAIFTAGSAAFFILSLFLSKWALTPVERAWEQQSRFVADASHELRTPLTVILANLKILAAHKTDTVQSQEKWLDNTQEEANRMKQLVEDLLFLAKSDAQATQTIMADLDFSNLAWERVLLFESLAFEQNLTLTSHIAPGIHLTGNESQIKQLLTILLDNGCKYAGKGGTVNLTLKKEQDKILLSVNNSGDPISPEDIGHLFERFYRADKSRVRKAGGYGLGLSIAKSIAESHHGKIAASSDPAHGTTFVVTF
ncbi:sensor histidine kinase [Clostridium sp. MCC353]|uniref:sensor histidine kinase n=1 Tax=Clostridium sp. MCC353 TaxID=2592646 RepID=UPI001C019B73|nr:ATP-binding protein [Clostridium sp. MCC353]MBT9779527.1 sensor histidine kinase [Clostridium sp. MCC353]